MVSGKDKYSRENMIMMNLVIFGPNNKLDFCGHKSGQIIHISFFFLRNVQNKKHLESFILYRVFFIDRDNVWDYKTQF